jgi:hypothetical protein
MLLLRRWRELHWAWRQCGWRAMVQRIGIVSVHAVSSKATGTWIDWLMWTMDTAHVVAYLLMGMPMESRTVRRPSVHRLWQRMGMANYPTHDAMVVGIRTFDSLNHGVDPSVRLAMIRVERGLQSMSIHCMGGW